MCHRSPSRSHNKSQKSRRDRSRSRIHRGRRQDRGTVVSRGGRRHIIGRDPKDVRCLVLILHRDRDIQDLNGIVGHSLRRVTVGKQVIDANPVSVDGAAPGLRDMEVSGPKGVQRETMGHRVTLKVAAM